MCRGHRTKLGVHGGQTARPPSARGFSSPCFNVAGTLYAALPAERFLPVEVPGPILLLNPSAFAKGSRCYWSRRRLGPPGMDRDCHVDLIGVAALFFLLLVAELREGGSYFEVMSGPQTSFARK